MKKIDKNQENKRAARSNKRNLEEKRKRKNRRKMLQGARRNALYQMYAIITHTFPEIFDWINELDDCRGKSKYELTEIIMAGIAMFLFKFGSRNEFNNSMDDDKFRKNYEKLFNLKLPHMDTVNRVMRLLSEEQLEQLKYRMIQVLFNRRVFHKYRFLRRWFVISIDATGVASFDHEHCGNCTFRRSKKGKKTWFHNVLEAKLVTPTGFSISISSVWIENLEEYYDKQDCERKAFKRLAEKIKKLYPRLPICIVADGLYPYKGFFDICKEYGWRYIVTLKDGCLSSVWEEVKSLSSLQKENNRHETIIEGKKKIQRDYKWITNIDYHGHMLQWLECNETVYREDKEDQQTRFVHITDIELDYQQVREVSATGRLRWKIENEGFNTQKNHGYNLKHKYSRKSFLAMKNYYQALQIAHLINQLLVLNKRFHELLEGKMTIKHIWKIMVNLMSYGKIEKKKLAQIDSMKCNLRLLE